MADDIEVRLPDDLLFCAFTSGMDEVKVERTSVQKGFLTEAVNYFGFVRSMPIPLWRTVRKTFET